MDGMATLWKDLHLELAYKEYIQNYEKGSITDSTRLEKAY